MEAVKRHQHALPPGPAAAAPEAAHAHLAAPLAPNGAEAAPIAAAASPQPAALPLSPHPPPDATTPTAHATAPQADAAAQAKAARVQPWRLKLHRAASAGAPSSDAAHTASSLSESQAQPRPASAAVSVSVSAPAPAPAVAPAPAAAPAPPPALAPSPPQPEQPEHAEGAEAKRDHMTVAELLLNASATNPSLKISDAEMDAWERLLENDGGEGEWGWKPLLADDKGAWAVSLGKPPGSHIQAIKGFMLFPKHSSATIFHIFHDLRTRMMWETTFKEMVSLSSFEDNHDIYYSSVRLPFPITDRDSLKTRRWRRKGDTYVTVHRSIVHPLKPPREDHVRSFALGVLKIEPLPPPQTGCRASILMQNDPKGLIPPVVINMIAPIAARKWIENITDFLERYDPATGTVRPRPEDAKKHRKPSALFGSRQSRHASEQSLPALASASSSSSSSSSSTPAEPHTQPRPHLPLKAATPPPPPAPPAPPAQPL